VNSEEGDNTLVKIKFNTDWVFTKFAGEREGARKTNFVSFDTSKQVRKPD